MIGVAGYYLSLYGDMLAEKTGLGRTWVGTVIIATVTSLPELASGISAVTAVGSPDLAVGDILGSCAFNLLIIVVLDFLYRRDSLYVHISPNHILAAGFGVILIGFAGFNSIVSHHGAAYAIAHVSLSSVILFVGYLIAMRVVFIHEKHQAQAAGFPDLVQYKEVPFAQAVVRFLISATVVVGAGVALPFIGEEIVEVMNWKAGFVGTFFLAFATSLPELAVTFSAYRLGAVDLAIGNLFGSNLFNMLVLVIDDIFYLPGPILADVSPLHAVTALSACMMTGAAIIGLLMRPKRQLVRAIGWASLAILLLYLLNGYVVYFFEK